MKGTMVMDGNARVAQFIRQLSWQDLPADRVDDVMSVVWGFDDLDSVEPLTGLLRDRR